MSTLTLNIIGKNTIEFTCQRLIIGGWAGRDKAAVDAHIKELQEIGITPPKKTPCFYPLAPQLLTTNKAIHVPRNDSSGEVECVIFKHDGVLYVGVGSDHTDRKVEAYDVTVSKQMCAKPIANTVWMFDEVKAHWDEVNMRCYRTLNGKKERYQEGKVNTLIHPLELIEKWTDSKGLQNGDLLFCGTQAVIGELGFGERFEVELHDPILNRTLSHTYDVGFLEVDE